MTLPVSVGPHHCALIYDQDKQPLLEMSLRICLPVKELIMVLSQMTPTTPSQGRTHAKAAAEGLGHDPARTAQGALTPAKSVVAQPKRPPLPQGSSSSNWRPSSPPWEPAWQVAWEPSPTSAWDWQRDWTPSQPQVEEQAQLLWALSDQAVPRYRRSSAASAKHTMPSKQCRDRESTTGPPPVIQRSDPSPTRSGPPQPSKPTEQPAEPRRLYDDEGEYIPPPKAKAHPKKCPVQ